MKKQILTSLKVLDATASQKPRNRQAAPQNDCGNEDYKKPVYPEKEQPSETAPNAKGKRKEAEGGLRVYKEIIYSQQKS